MQHFAAAGRIGYRYGYLHGFVKEVAKAEPVDEFFNGVIPNIFKAYFADLRHFSIHIEHFFNIVLIAFLRFISGRILRVDTQDVFAFLKQFSQLCFTVKRRRFTVEGAGVGHRSFSVWFRFRYQAHARFSVFVPMHVFVHISVGLVHKDGRKGRRLTILFDGFIRAFHLISRHVRHTDRDKVLLSGCFFRLELAVDAVLLNFKDVFISPGFGVGPGLAAVQRVFPRGDVAYTHCHVRLEPYGFLAAPAIRIYRIAGQLGNIGCQLLTVVQLKAVAAFCGIARVVSGSHRQRVHAILGDVCLNILTVLSFMLRRHYRLLGFVIQLPAHSRQAAVRILDAYGHRGIFCIPARRIGRHTGDAVTDDRAAVFRCPLGCFSFALYRQRFRHIACGVFGTNHKGLVFHTVYWQRKDGFAIVHHYLCGNIADAVGKRMITAHGVIDRHRHADGVVKEITKA